MKRVLYSRAILAAAAGMLVVWGAGYCRAAEKSKGRTYSRKVNMHAPPSGLVFSPMDTEGTVERGKTVSELKAGNSVERIPLPQGAARWSPPPPAAPGAMRTRDNKSRNWILSPTGEGAERNVSMQPGWGWLAESVLEMQRAGVESDESSSEPPGGESTGSGGSDSSAVLSPAAGSGASAFQSGAGAQPGVGLHLPGTVPAVDSYTAPWSFGGSESGPTVSSGAKEGTAGASGSSGGALIGVVGGHGSGGSTAAGSGKSLASGKKSGTTGSSNGHGQGPHSLAVQVLEQAGIRPLWGGNESGHDGLRHSSEMLSEIRANLFGKISDGGGENVESTGNKGLLAGRAQPNAFSPSTVQYPGAGGGNVAPPAAAGFRSGWNSPAGSGGYGMTTLAGGGATPSLRSGSDLFKANRAAGKTLGSFGASYQSYQSYQPWRPMKASVAVGRHGSGRGSIARRPLSTGGALKNNMPVNGRFKPFEESLE